MSRLKWKAAVNILDKNRQNVPGSPPRCLPLLLIILTITACISMWQLIESPMIVLSFKEVVSNQSNILIFFKNTTVSAEQSYRQRPYQQSTDATLALEESSFSDASTLIDLHDFRFIINHNFCERTSPLLHIFVHTAPDHFEHRNVIRETWGRRRPEIMVLFLLGWSDKYASQIMNEDEKYMDIIQGNFVDAYRNMTYKHVMLLKWVTYQCPNVKNVLKVDDDVFVHIPAIIKFLNTHKSTWGRSKLIMCGLQTEAYPERSVESKWYVTENEYPGKKYPTYCPGWIILYSADCIPLLYRQAQKEPYFWIDDVHVSGTLAKKVNITHKSFNSLILSGARMEKLLNDSTAKTKFIFGPANIDKKNIIALNNLVVSGAV